MGRWSPFVKCDHAIFIDKCCRVADVTCKKTTQYVYMSLQNTAFHSILLYVLASL